MSDRFEHRVVLVTGGASGIGKAVAERMLSEGARAIVWDISRDRLDGLAQTYGERLLCQCVDVADENAVATAMELAVRHFGKLDVVVNCAGVIGPTEPFWKTESRAFRRLLDINVLGTFSVVRAAAPHLIANGYGRVVNLASILGKEGGANFTAYSTSKAAILGMTKSMAKDLVAHNVLVNAVAPAAINTEIFQQTPADYKALTVSRIPMGRAGELHEAAAMLSWVASHECSFSTGSVFDLSGGRATY